MALTKMFTGSSEYLLSPQLARDFQIARTLGMPLLVEGEPGTGKTELAIQYAAYNNLSLYAFPVTSKSTIEQLISTYDSVQMLTDGQFEILNAQREMAGLQGRIDMGGRQVDRPSDYVRLGPLALAYRDASQDHNPVLLIDEIDKAPREFLNSFLYPLSQYEIIIPETRQSIKITPENMPVIVITNNGEQALPHPLLRRCVYHWIPFPDKETMAKIVYLHHQHASPELVDASIAILYQLRELGLEKNPATSELLNWVKYLQEQDRSIKLSELNKLPGSSLLIKTRADLPTLRQIEQWGIEKVLAMARRKKEDDR